MESRNESLQLDCPICGAREAQSFAFSKWSVDIMECLECGSASAAVPIDFNPEEIYTESYFQGGQKDGYGDYASAEQVIRREFRSSLRQLERSGVRKGRLLEIGSAYGFFLREAEPDFQGIGIEVSSDAREYGRRMGVNLFASISDSEVIGGKPYSALVLLDCIEHLEDPYETLRSASQLLGDQASILITTGDWGSFFARKTKSHWRLMTPPQHLHFFTREGMERLLSRIDFEIVSFEHPGRLIPIGLAAYQAFERLGLPLQVPKRLNRLGLPLNLFDCMRVVARRKHG
jgi:SAM-dependent methyltransferase